MDNPKTLNETYGIVLDPKSPEFEDGKGRLIYIKWRNMPYMECTHECEQDLILNKVKYHDELISFELRDLKPYQRGVHSDAIEIRQIEMTRLEKIFRSKSGCEMYEHSLKDQVFKNGQKLSNQQAEGVRWLMHNHIHNTPSLLVEGPELG